MTFEKTKEAFGRMRRSRALHAALAVLGALLFFLYFLPGPLLRFAAGRAHADFGLQGARWLGVSGLELDGVSLGTYFTADAIRLRWKWEWLLRHHRFHEVEFVHPEVYVNELDAAFPATAVPKEKAGGADPLEIVRRWAYQIQIDHGTIWLGPFGPGLPMIHLTVGRHQPLKWTTGSLDKADDKNDPLQVAETSDLRFYSPLNPMAPVLDLGTLRVTFTWRGLERHQIAGISVVGPTLFIGPNLFAFFDAVQKGPASTPAPASAPAPAPAAPPAAPDPEKTPWVVQNVALTGGILRITAFGEPGVVLPFTFRSSGQNIDLSRIDDLRLQNRLEIDKKSFDYPSYGIAITGFDGHIDFDLPPEHNARNVVQTISLQEISWKGLKADKVFVTVTFNKTGIYGRLGGETYGGYMNGDYHVGFADGFPWHAGLYLDHAEVGEPVDKLAHGDFTLSGKAGFSLTVDAHSRNIDDCHGDLAFAHGGLLRVPAAQNLSKSIPASADGPAWRNELQSQMLERVLQSFYEYPFSSGTLHFSYGLPKSILQLNLEGSAGRRNFTINWNQEGGGGVVLPEKTPPKVSVRMNP